MNPAIRTILFGAAPFTLAQLFRNAEPGVWFDKDDLSTMYQDSAGTTPAYAPGQGSADCPIGLWLDKSQGMSRGSELVATAADQTGSSDAGFWTRDAGITVSSGFVWTAAASTNSLYHNAILSPGSSYEVTWTISSVTGGALQISATNPGTSNTSNPSRNTPGTYTEIITPGAGQTAMAIRAVGVTTAKVTSISWKKVAGNHASQSTANSRPTLSARYNLLLATAALSTQSVTVAAASYVLSFTGTGTVTLSGTSTAGPLVGTGANNRVSLTFTPTAGSLTLTVSGSVTLADLRLAADAALAIPAYQAITSATTYDTAGFPQFLKCDGFDDGMATPAIDFTGTDKMTVWAGVTKLSDAAVGVIVELGASAGGGINGTFVLHGQTTPVGYRFAAGSGTSGTAFGTDDCSVFTAPVSNVISCKSDFAGVAVPDEIQVRLNGATPTQSYLGTVSAGSYGSFPLYLFRRGGSSLPFNGRCYGLAVVGRTATTRELTGAERILARNMGLSF
jgi:hypothetical protein